jgi:hypothetical protein
MVICRRWTGLLARGTVRVLLTLSALLGSSRMSATSPVERSRYVASQNHRFIEAAFYVIAGLGGNGAILG